MKGFRKKLTFPAFCLTVGLVVFGVSYTMLGRGPGTQHQHTEERSFFDVLSGGDVAELQQRLDAGADPNEKNGDGITPLSWAILGMETTPTVFSQVKALIAAGADPNIVDNYGRTSLHYAAQYDGSDAVTQALIDTGVGVDTKNQAGLSALQLAAMSGNDGARAVIELATTTRPPEYEKLKAVGRFSQRLSEAKTEAERKGLVGREALVMVERGWMTEEERQALLRAFETLEEKAK